MLNQQNLNHDGIYSCTGIYFFKSAKSNNVDMKNWSAVRVEEEKENLDQVYWEMDPLYRESSMKKAEIFIADGISLTQILETLMQLAQYI